MFSVAPGYNYSLSIIFNETYIKEELLPKYILNFIRTKMTTKVPPTFYIGTKEDIWIIIADI